MADHETFLIKIDENYYSFVIKLKKCVDLKQFCDFIQLIKKYDGGRKDISQIYMVCVLFSGDLYTSFCDKNYHICIKKNTVHDIATIVPLSDDINTADDITKSIQSFFTGGKYRMSTAAYINSQCICSHDNSCFVGSDMYLICECTFCHKKDGILEYRVINKHNDKTVVKNLEFKIHLNFFAVDYIIDTNNENAQDVNILNRCVMGKNMYDN